MAEPTTTHRRVTRQADLPLSGSFEAVFPLFGPLREADWAEGWHPEPLGEVPEPMEAGFAFRTRHEPPGPAVWTLTEYAREGSDTERRGRVRYAMVAETSHVSRVSIDLSPANRGCTARVRYDLTGLTDKGDDFIEGVTEDCFDGWIAEWRQAIEHYLSTGKRLVSHRVHPVERVAGDADATHKERIDG